MAKHLESFKDGESVSLKFIFDLMDIEQVSYTIKDGRSGIVAENIPVAIDSSLLSAVITIPAEYNLLDERERDLRRVIVTVKTSSTNVEFERVYVLMSDFELSVPAQSFVSIADAQMHAIDMLNGDAFIADGESQMRRRLIEATNRIKSLSFSIRRIYGVDYDDYDRPQNMLNTTTMPFGAAGQYRFDLIDWDTLSDEEFFGFPDAFRNALMSATINEACEIANGNDIQSARADGIVSESIGETTMAYRQGKAAISEVSRTTWRSLVKYLNNRTVVRRS